MLDLQGVVGFCAKGLTNSVAVLWTPLERPQNKHVQGSLKQFDAISIRFPPGHTRSGRQSTIARLPDVISSASDRPRDVAVRETERLHSNDRCEAGPPGIDRRVRNNLVVQQPSVLLRVRSA